MSQSEKAELYNELKAAGVKFDRHYREYSTDELKVAVNALRAQQAELAPPTAAPETDLPSVSDVQAAVAEARQRNAAGQWRDEPQVTVPREMLENAPADAQSQVNEQLRRSVAQQRPTAPVAQANPNEMPGQRLNSQSADEPIRTDENGLVWYQEEVLKPAFPKPRGRRVLKYMETGVKEVTTKNGEYVETFEVAGDRQQIPAEVKITLPSYQVGIYKDPRFPFKIHVYNGNRGFDLFEVQKYYGGSELVPAEIKRIYVENVLCYDIRTTVRAIQTEYRALQLAGKVK